MDTVKEIMNPIKETLTPQNNLYEAIGYMKEHRWNTVPVTNDIGQLIGVFTRSDLYQMLMLNKSFEAKISDFIEKDQGTISVSTPLEQLEEITAKSKVGTGIVIDYKKKPVGIITKTAAVMNFLNRTRVFKEQLETILQAYNLGTFMTDHSNRIIFVNDKLTEMTGMRKSELLYKDFQKVFSKWNFSTKEREIFLNVKINSRSYIFRLTKYNMQNGKQGYIALLQNVSELENIAKELEVVKSWKDLLQTVLDNSYDGYIMINAKSEIIFLSQSLIQLFDLQGKEVNNTHVETLFPQFMLSKVLKTGVIDISDFMEIKGINYIVHRIPVYQGDEIIGAIGKIVYRQLDEVHERFKRYENIETTIPTNNFEYSKFNFDEILTHDPQMKKLIRSGIKAAKGKTTVLIRGESGTGKELFAHAIHSTSTRSRAPFITVNCAAIPESLLESEFFGYDEGAFTGAKHKGKVGKFDMANGGTLFLDEVGDMSLQIQAKLLRVLQEREFYRVGGAERVEVDIRVIAATNRPLEEMIEKGEFREDLFYRLNVISFEIPPLRRRKQDIVLYGEHFIQQLNKQNGTSIVGWDETVEQVLFEYDWPGNVRELRNVFERAMIFAENGHIQLEDLPEYVLKHTGYNELGEDLEDNQPLLEKAEKNAIYIALRKVNGNKSKACKILGISRSVLYEKLKKYEIDK